MIVEIYFSYLKMATLTPERWIMDNRCNTVLDLSHSNITVDLWKQIEHYLLNSKYRMFTKTIYLTNTGITKEDIDPQNPMQIIF